MSPNFLSPGVYTIEKDISEYSPTLNSSIVGIVGFASKGPTNKATLITSAENLVKTFGNPSEAIYGQALEGALEILETTNQLYFIRCADETTALEASALVPLGSPPVIQLGPSGFGVTSSIVLKVQVTDEAGTDLFDPVKTYTIPSGTMAAASFSGGVRHAQYAAVRSIVGGDLAGNNVFTAYRPTSLTATDPYHTFICGAYAGSGASLTVSAYESDGTTSITDAVFPVNQINSTIIVADGTWVTSGAVAATAYGSTIESPESSAGIAYRVKSLWPGAGYNLSTNAAGDTVGISIEVNQAGDSKSILTVNSDAAAAENYYVSLTDNVATWVEGVINIGTTSPVSEYIQGVIVSGNGVSDKGTDIVFAGIDEATWGFKLSTHLGNGKVTGRVGGDNNLSSIDPIFIKFNDSTTNLVSGHNGDSDTATVNDAAIIGDATSDPKTGMQLLDDPTIDISIAVVPGVFSQNVQNNLITLAENTQNFLAVVAPPEGVGNVQDAIDWTNGQTDSRTASINSSWVAVYWPHVKTYSVFDGLDRYYDPAIYGVRQMAYTDKVADAWFAPAGYVRGRLTKPTETEVVLNKGDRDSLYSGGNIINPIVNFPQQGITVFGQRTAQRTPSALDRVNVRRLMIVIRKLLLASTQQFVFEPNDEITWDRIEGVVQPLLDDIKRRRGITDFKVICDSTTNTPVRIDRNELWCKILVKPTKTAEMIVFELNITSQSAKLG